MHQQRHTRAELHQLSKALLRLHKALLDGHPSFAWLRQLSRVMAEVDDVADAGNAGNKIAELTASLRTLLTPVEGDEAFSGLYHRALQPGSGGGSIACGGQTSPRRLTAGTEDVMKAQYLGHVVFYVKDLERSLAFYRDLLGFNEVGRIFNGAAAALTSGRTHHEVLLIQVGDAPGPSPGRHRGLYHVGIKIGDSLDDLRQAKRQLEQAGVAIDGMSDHTVSQSLYLRDPDGIEVELYVDADEAIWKADPAAVLSPIKPLQL